MKSLFLKKEFKYDGQQLTPLWAYQNHGIAGDSLVSWVGACDIPFGHMVDAEDQIAKAEIRGDLMLHFIIEIFDRELFSAVSLQRLFAAIIKDHLNSKLKSKSAKSKSKFRSKNKKTLRVEGFHRSGDDLYWGQQKLSISIASCSAVSCQIHFAMNIKNSGTPVETCGLEDFGLQPKPLAIELMKLMQEEYESIRFATQKVHPL